ncbi:MAG: type IX secretion system membrane protein PorP/SprF, partial [Flavobacteriaceae bacterium]|nr:type IX secretion system membrane protein PorP/SprF [Flavobacteriaceae bacterium]
FYRNQWSGISGSPRTFAASFITPLNGEMTLGLNAVLDEVYVLKENHFYANFGYKLKLNDDSNLVLGLKAGLSNLKVDLNSVELIDNDPLFSESMSTSNFNMGVGAWYQYKNWYLSVSVPAFFKNKRYEKQNAEPIEGVEDVAVFLGTGYRFALNDNWGLTPSTLIKSVSGVSTSVDITTTLHYKKIDFGANYRVNESFTGFVYLDNLDFLSFGLGYETATTDINEYASGTFEILLGFKF